MKTKHKKYLGLGVILVILVISVVALNRNNNQPSYLDEFAKCLTDSGAKLYGAYWCPHCKDQKELFGDSIEYINYIECSLPNNAGQTEVCKEAGIRAYPTWIFGDGTKIEGGLSIEQLSTKSDCPVPE